MGELTKQGEVSHYWPVNPSGWKNELGDLNSRANFLISYPLLEKIKINPPNSMSYQALTLYWTWNRYLLWSEHLGPLLTPCWNLNVQCDGVRRWAFGWWLAHDGGALVNGVSDDIKKEETQSFLTPHSGRKDTLRKWTIYEAGSRPFPDAKTVRNKFLWFISLLSLWSSVTVQQMDEDKRRSFTR